MLDEEQEDLDDDERDASVDRLIDFDESLTAPGPSHVGDLHGGDEKLADMMQCVSLLHLYRHANAGEDLAADELAGVPESFGHYRIDALLGNGSSGIVYLARDTRLDRLVALKLLRSESTYFPELRTRFAREACAAARLKHPNVVEIYDVGELEGVRYIASSYFADGTLRDWLDAGNEASPRLAARLLKQLADATQHAHARGVLHRDIKPSNVMLELQGQGAIRCLLGDFGLVRFLDEDTGLTDQGVSIGTPSYMSPEQARGDWENVGVPGDIWSLGAMLFELLSGSPPFGGSRRSELLRKLDTGVPPRLRTRAPQVPKDLAAICDKCLRTSIRERYSTAAELSGDLEAFLDNRPTVARPLSTPMVVMRWAKHHVAWTSLILMTCLFTVIIGILGWWSATRLSRSLDQNRRMLFVADVRLAADALDHSHAQRARQLLRRYVPQGNGVDRRNFAWHYLWSQLHQELATHRRPHGDDVPFRAMDVSHDVSHFAAGDGQGVVYIWDARSDAAPRHINTGGVSVFSIALMSDGHGVVADFDGNLYSWDNSSNQAHRIKSKSDVEQVRYSHRHRLLAIGFNNGDIELCDAESFEPLTRLRGHAAAITDISFFSDSRQLASVSRDRSVRVWEWNDQSVVESRVLADSLRDDSSFGMGKMRFDSVSVSPDEATVAFGSNFGHVFVWDLQEDREVFQNRVHNSNVLSMDWAPQSRNFATASKDGSVCVWQPHESTPTQTFRGHGRPVYGVRFIGKDELLSTGKDAVVRRWKMTNKCYSQHAILADALWSSGNFGWLPSRKTLVAGSWWGVVGSAELDSKKFRRMPFALMTGANVSHSGDNSHAVAYGGELIHYGVTSTDRLGVKAADRTVDFDLDGDGDKDRLARLASSQAFLWQERVSGETLKPPRLWTAGRELEFRPSARIASIDGSLQLVRITDRQLHLCDLADQDLGNPSIAIRASIDLNQPKGWMLVSDVDADGDDDLLLTERHGKQLTWLEQDSGRLTPHRSAVFEERIRQLTALRRPGGVDIVALDETGVVWRVPELESRLSVKAQRLSLSISNLGTIDRLDADLDGNDELLVVTDQDCRVFRNSFSNLAPEELQVHSLNQLMDSFMDPVSNVVKMDVARREIVSELQVPTGEITSVALSDDGEQVATVDLSRCIRIWDAKTGEYQQQLSTAGDWGEIDSLVFTKYDRQLVFSSGNNISVWQRPYRGQPTVLRGHDNTIVSVEPSPASGIVASLSHDASVRLWDTDQEKLLRILIGHSRPPVAAAFSQDGRLLVTGDDRGQLIVWDVETGQDLVSLDDFDCDDLHLIRFLDKDTLMAVGVIRESKECLVGHWQITSTR